ncbi:MAG: hypothetical protein ACXWEX_01880, partial [Thermoanaerobaculia bacterium]
MSATVEVPKSERPDAATLRVTCPATGDLAGEVPDVDAEGVAAAVAEAYRLAGRRETFLDFVRSLPPAQRSAPDFGM